MNFFKASAAVLFSFLTVIEAHATIAVGLQAQTGNPTGATADASNHTHYLIERPQYSLDYDDTTHEPNWVSWDLTTSDVGDSGRSPVFFVDTSLPAGFYQVQTTDYSGSGYDRGHMCPSADRTITRADNDVTFFMSNMVPQTPDNNQGVWANFENYSRSLASAGNEILIISGPSGFGGSNLTSGVSIPGYTWKIILVVPNGPGSAVSRITPSTRIITIKIPNIAGVRSTPWQNFVTSVAQIEADTGYTFLTALPAATANALRTVVDGQSAAGAPAIVSQPTSQTTVVGGSASFSVTATGDETLTYQWSLGDDEIPGATSSTLTLSNVQAADVGSYTVVVTNAIGSATSNAAALIVTGLPPSITTSPAAQSVSAGTTVTFSVAASGSPTLSYQWRKDFAPIPGATSSALSLSNVQSGDQATYDVVVTNSVSFATSGSATLTVNAAAPSITGQPVSKTTSTGSNASFTVAASGSAPLSYQWRKGGVALSNGGVISGATTATLLLTGVSAIDAGDYDVVVTNALGFIPSALASLTVNPPPPSTVYWNFTTADPTSGLTADITGGTVTQGNNNGTTPLLTTTSASSGYTGVSGGNNAGAAARIGALVKVGTATTGSAYFEFTLNASAGKRLLASGISFGMRSTGTGPQAFGVYTSLDGFANPVASGTVLNDSNWHLFTPAFSTVTGATGAPVTFRIYGYNGAGSPGANTANWRLDDLKLTVTTVFPPPVPPVVTSTTPVANATDVAITAPLTISFNEAVTFTGSWFTINSALNGPIAATVTGGPTSFTLTPPSFFANNDTITVTVHGAQVVDQATGTIAGTSDTTFSFTTESFVPPTPPTVSTQPTSQSVNVGANASFTVAATGTPPFTYQWRKNGSAILGNSSASTATLTLSNVTTADAGSFDCVVSNVAGSDLSQAAVLTVTIVPPTITTQPVAQAASVGGNASFIVTASGTAPFTYQWRKNGAPIPSATAATLSLTNLTYADSAVYDVVVTNAATSVPSSSATLAVLDTAPSVITWDFATATPTSGVPAGVTGGAFSQGNNNGTTPLLTTTSASNAYVGASGGNNAGAAARTGGLVKIGTSTTGSAFFEFTFAAPAGRQFAATALSFGMRSTGTGPQAFALFSSADGFATPIASGTVPADSVWRLFTPAFAGVASAVGEPITFRLFGYNGAGSPGANTANWRIDDVKLTAGLLALPPVPPTITLSPSSLTATVGDTVNFHVEASGTAPLSYQWRKQAQPIAGNASANSSTLVLPSITTTDAADYDCVVTNIAGFATSGAAALTVSKASASVTLGTLSFTYDGSAHAASATTAPEGLVVTFTYNGSATAPVNAGSYAVVATIDDANYSGSASDTLVIAPASASVSLGNLSQTYNGAARSVSVTTAPAALDVVVTYNGSPVAPINVGSYAVAATITDSNYVGSTSGTLLVTPASADVAISDFVQAYDGAPKSVTVTTVPANLPVTVTYNGSATPPIYPGEYAVVATIDAGGNYTGSSNATLFITVTALVRHAPTLNGGLDGSVQMLLPENVTLNGSAWVAGDLLIPGTPALQLNGKVSFVGTKIGEGSAAPTGHRVTLNSPAALRYLVTHVDPIAFPAPIVPPASAGTRSVSINNPSQSAGDFGTLRDLTLNSNVGQFAIPAGTYGNFTANGGSGFTLGVSGATTPVVYNFKGLTLNSNTQLVILSPVIIHVASAVAVNGTVGSAAHPEWLIVTIASGGLTLNSNVTFNGFVTAPAGTVTLNGATLNGGVVSDRLTLNSNSVLHDAVP
jgi:DNA/RNA endonuclease G (NUC1)